MIRTVQGSGYKFASEDYANFQNDLARQLTVVHLRFEKHQPLLKLINFSLRTSNWNYGDKANAVDE